MSQAEKIPPQTFLDPVCALEPCLESFFPGSHRTRAQPYSTRQDVELISHRAVFRHKQRKLLVSAYLSTFIKWNKLFLNTRVANSLRGN